MTLKYAVSGRGRYLVLLRNNISFGAYAGGLVSLPLGRSEISFPVLKNRELGDVFEAKAVGGRNVVLTIEACRAHRIGLLHSEVIDIR